MKRAYPTTTGLIVSLMMLIVAVWSFGFITRNVLAAEPPDAPKIQHVILISVDGLRPDAIDAADAKTIQSLIQRGTWCPKAETVRPSYTLPSHVAMVTGLDITRHGVTWNNNSGAIVQHPTIMTIAKQHGHSVGLWIGKDKLQELAAPNTLDHFAGAVPGQPGYASAAKLTDDFVKVWPNKKHAFVFIHYSDPDGAGHAASWMSQRYLDAVRDTDWQIGRILDSVKNTGVESNTVIIVTADHGGHGYGHGEDLPENVTIPWICAGPGIRAGQIINRVIRIYDTMPTVLAFLELTPPANIDGRIVAEVARRPPPPVLAPAKP